MPLVKVNISCVFLRWASHGMGDLRSVTTKVDLLGGWMTSGNVIQPSNASYRSLETKTGTIQTKWSAGKATASMMRCAMDQVKSTGFTVACSRKMTKNANSKPLLSYI